MCECVYVTYPLPEGSPYVTEVVVAIHLSHFVSQLARTLIRRRP